MSRTVKKFGSAAVSAMAILGYLSGVVAAAPSASAAPCHGVNSYEEHVYNGGAPGANVTYISAHAKMDSCQVKEYSRTLNDRAAAKNYLAGLAALAPGYYSLIAVVPATDAFIDTSEASNLERCSDGFTRGVDLKLRNGRVQSCRPQ